MSEQVVTATVWKTNRDKYPGDNHVVFAITEPVPELGGKRVFNNLGRSAPGSVPPDPDKDQIASGAKLRLTAVEYTPEQFEEEKKKKRGSNDPAPYWGKDVSIISLGETAAGTEVVTKPQASAPKPKIKRLITVPEELPPIYGKGADLCVKTFNNAGEPSAEKIIISATGLVTVKDRGKGGPLYGADPSEPAGCARQVRNFIFVPDNGLQDLIIEANDLSTDITFTHEETKETVTVTLNYR